MKKIISIIIVTVLLFSTQSLVFADNNINVTVDGSEVQFDVKPFIDSSNRTLIPVRFVSEKLGATVGWDDSTSTVTVDLDNKHIALTINQKEILVNGSKQTMDTQAIIKESRTFVPVRFVAEALGANVDWVSSTRTVKITTADAVVGIEQVLTTETAMNAVFENYQEETTEYIDIQKIIVKTEPTYTFSIKENNGTKGIVTQNNEHKMKIDLLKNGKKIEGTPSIFSPTDGVTYHTFTVEITTVDEFSLYNYNNDTMIIVPNPFKE